MLMNQEGEKEEEVKEEKEVEKEEENEEEIIIKKNWMKMKKKY